AHVTMLQRSPSYVVSRPSHDTFANYVRRVLPTRAAYVTVRWKNVLLSTFWYWFARRNPELLKRVIMGRAQKELGNEFDVNTHFNPRYKPWDERMCLAPDSDLFRALQSGSANIVTDELETFTPTGINTRAGLQLDADVVVMATGLNLRLLNGVELIVDGRKVELNKTMAYKGMMLSDVPNLVSAFGYTNASWTLKCDLTAEFVCRLLQFMDRHNLRQFTPRPNDPTVASQPVLDFTSGYVKRGLPWLPTQGSKAPWRLRQNYLRDLMMLRFGKLKDGVLEFE
ncbi:MAG: NAD(P)/FAD-dependent oxidoreductase, partial [Gemmatimonadaceae bacterium]